MTFLQEPSSVTIGKARHLSPRESEIIHFLAQGLACKEIAARLSMSYAAVWTYVERIYAKLHVHSRCQAVAKYLSDC